MERGSVATAWKTPVTLAGLITGIAFINYMYVRGVWLQTGELQIIYRYIEWLITMPLQIIMFYLILAAVRKVSSGMFWRLLIGSLVMLIGGYLGEAAYIHSMVGFIIWMAGWIYVLYANQFIWLTRFRKIFHQFDNCLRSPPSVSGSPLFWQPDVRNNLGCNKYWPFL